MRCAIWPHRGGTASQRTAHSEQSDKQPRIPPGPCCMGALMCAVSLFVVRCLSRRVPRSDAALSVGAGGAERVRRSHGSGPMDPNAAPRTSRHNVPATLPRSPDPPRVRAPDAGSRMRVGPPAYWQPEKNDERNAIRSSAVREPSGVGMPPRLAMSATARSVAKKRSR